MNVPVNRALLLCVVLIGLFPVSGYPADPAPAPLVGGQFITVTGGSPASIRVPWQPGLTLQSALNEANLGDFQQPRRVYLIRGKESLLYDLRKLRKDPASDPKLQPGDIIRIPEAVF